MRYVPVTSYDAERFNALREEHAMTVYMHSSYWINIATGRPAGRTMSERFLCHELRAARQLGIPYLVLHPGAAIDYPASNDRAARLRGIDTFAAVLNKLLKAEPDVMVLLENTAHGGRVVGSDLKDLSLIFQKIDYPERIGFCIDYAHAFVFGYDLNQTDTFVSLVDRTIGWEKVKLIHLNDAYDPPGSMQDRHAIPGEGNIGKMVLRKLLYHPSTASIPHIIEPPLVAQEQLKKIIIEMYGW